MNVIAKIFDLVPGWVYGLLLALVLAWGGVQSMRAGLARAQLDQAIQSRNDYKSELDGVRRRVELNTKKAGELLLAETAKVADGEARLRAVTQKMESDRAESQTQLAAAVAARSRTERLSFRAPAAGACSGGGGGGGAAAQAPGSTPDPASEATVVLPERVASRLWGLARDAESLSIDYRVLYDWANNPAMVCSMSGG